MLADPVDVVASEVADAMIYVPRADIAELARRLNEARHVLVAGEGRSGLMAKAFAMRLMQLGLSVHVIGETTTPAITANDDLVAVSGSGSTPATIRVVQRAREIGATVLAVTANPDSPLASQARFVLCLPGATKYRRAGEASTAQPLSSLFDQVAHLALDAVCLHLAGLRGVGNAEARRAHSTE